jgi:CTP synthase (UTP-ammonia lyase)
MVQSARVALVGDRDDGVVAHRSIPLAIEAVNAAGGASAHIEWVGTEAIGDAAHTLADFDGVWCVPASPYRSMQGALAAIRFARETGRPFLGTCGGFQHAVIEIARDVLGVTEADHAETNPGAASLVVTPLACSLFEVTGSVLLDEDFAARLGFPSVRLTEGYHCSYGMNPVFVDSLAVAGVRIVGRDEAGEPRVLELLGHPFFVATLFQPERSGLRGEQHPLITAFVSAAATYAEEAVGPGFERKNREAGG